MKLDPDLKAKLLAKNPSLESAVDDACELLTMKVVLLLTRRRKELDAAIEAAKSDPDHSTMTRSALVGRRQEANEIIILLSEIP